MIKQLNLIFKISFLSTKSRDFMLVLSSSQILLTEALLAVRDAT